MIMKNLSGKTIYIVRHENVDLLKTLDFNVAKETLNDFNFEIPKGLKKAKLFKATIK